MFSLIETVEISKPALSRRVKNSFAGVSGTRVFEDSFLGVRYAKTEIEIYDGLTYPQLEKRFLQAGAALKEAGVKDVCFSNGFEHEALFLNEGFARMDSRFLYERLAGDIVKSLGKGDKNKKVAFFSGRVSQHEERALLIICSSFRHIMLDVRQGGDMVCRNIRARMGIAVIENPTEKQLGEADIALFFSKPIGEVVLPPKCTAVTVSGENLKDVSCRRRVTRLRLSLPRELSGELPANFPPEPLVAMGAKLGRVNTNRIKIEALAVEQMKEGLDRN